MCWSEQSLQRGTDGESWDEGDTLSPPLAPGWSECWEPRLAFLEVHLWASSPVTLSPSLEGSKLLRVCRPATGKPVSGVMFVNVFLLLTGVRNSELAVSNVMASEGHVSGGHSP